MEGEHIFKQINLTIRNKLENNLKKEAIHCYYMISFYGLD
jgi:hypothetical protein